MGAPGDGGGGMRKGECSRGPVSGRGHCEGGVAKYREGGPGYVDDW